jgi:Ca2+-transporting ATPase
MPKNPYYTIPYQEVLNKLNTSPKKGLSKEEFIKRQNKYGSNEIIDDKPKHLILQIIWNQLNNLLVFILLLAAIVTYFLDHKIDTYVIIFVILSDAVIGFAQEYKANKAIESLKKIVVANSKVYRDGHLIEIPSKNLVPGDIVLLEEGDRVPADGRLIESHNLRVVESSLTGESFAVEKNIEAIKNKTPLADRKNYVWMSTFVVGGFAKFVITETGNHTAIGQIAKTLGEIKKEKSHFDIKTEHLVKQMSIISIFGALFIFIMGYFSKSMSFADIFTFAVASLVSGIPEGLPVVLVIILAYGARKMANKNAIIRSLPATETLSVTDIIATDKTGTLTQNSMTIKEIYLNKQSISVSGSGWNPQGKFFKKEKVIDPIKNFALKKLIRIASLNSRARLIKQDNKKNINYQISGDPTEGAATVLGHKAKLAEQLKKIQIINQLPFDQELKLKAISVRENGNKEIYVSGAPESIIKFCNKQLINKEIKNFNEKDKEEVLEKVKEYSAQAMRVIAHAYKKTSSKKSNITVDEINNLVFVGFVGMIDPPRKGVRDAISKAKRAGIRVIMKTGDHKETALAIAKQVGIIENEEQVGEYSLVMTENDLEELSPQEFDQAIEQVSVFARLTPKMKLRILERLQKLGHIVAMTGDGVNDVLALKKANIGIAMGQIGTDVAREASDIVLADDNFASLIDAVEEGRVVFSNTRQASAFLITTNLAEYLIIIISIAFGLPLPLLATQILWVNLVTDGLVDIPLAVEPGHGDVLNQKPRAKDENILSKKMLGFLTPIVLCMVISSLWMFIDLLPQGIEKARTGAFLVICLTQLVNIFNMRSLDRSLFSIGFFSNKYLLAAVFGSLIMLYLALTNEFLVNIFRFTPLDRGDIIEAIVLSSLVLFIGEFYKLGRNLIKNKT